jgi:hypothetical protein
MQCLKSQHSFPYGLEIMIFGLCNGGDGTDPITPSAGVAGVGFDATYDLLVNTLTSGGAKEL